MAGLKCINCGNGIRYHDEPNGIEYTIFSEDAWKKVITTEYDPNNEMIHTEWLVPGPYLYQADTIWEDFKNEYQEAWVCPKCGTIAVFVKGGIQVESVCVPFDEDIETAPNGTSYVVFSDYLWDEITDLSIPVSKIPDTYKPSFVAVANDDYMWLLSSDLKDRNNIVKKYRRIPISKS